MILIDHKHCLSLSSLNHYLEFCVRTGRINSVVIYSEYPKSFGENGVYNSIEFATRKREREFIVILNLKFLGCCICL